jgi:hypothetical protein
MQQHVPADWRHPLNPSDIGSRSFSKTQFISNFDNKPIFRSGHTNRRDVFL